MLSTPPCSFAASTRARAAASRPSGSAPSRIRLHGRVGQHVGEPIRAYEIDLAGAGILLQNLGADVVAHPHALGEDVRPGMAARLVGRQRPGVQLLLDPSVVSGKLPEPSILIDIRAAVSHVADDHAPLLRTYDQRGQGGAHTLALGRHGPLGADPDVGALDRFHHPLAQGGRRSSLCPEGARHGLGDGSAAGAARPQRGR